MFLTYQFNKRLILTIVLLQKRGSHYYVLVHRSSRTTCGKLVLANGERERDTERTRKMRKYALRPAACEYGSCAIGRNKSDK